MNIVDISDHPILGLKRKVSWKTFIFSLEDEKVSLFTKCLHYTKAADENGDPFLYGDPFSSAAVRDFERILIASNTRMIDPSNGLVCSQDENGIWINVAGQTVLGGPMGQFDFFKILIQNSIQIIPLIEGIILQEDMYFGSYN